MLGRKAMITPLLREPLETALLRWSREMLNGTLAAALRNFQDPDNERVVQAIRAEMDRRAGVQ